MVRKLRDDNLRRGIAADKTAAEEALPYEAEGILSDGDSVRDYRDGQDDSLAEYRMYDSGRAATLTVSHVLGGDKIEYPAYYRCVEEGIEFFHSPADPRKAPMTCPVCGADGSDDGVDTCTDAHGDEDDGHSGSEGTQDTRDAPGDDRQQATLSGYGGGSN